MVLQLDEETTNTLELDPQTFEDIDIEDLIELGLEQGYVTSEDILDAIPEAERNISQLKKVLETLHKAGISHEEMGEFNAANGKHSSADSQETALDTPLANADDPLENIETQDLVGLYLKEATRVPLLSREEEAALAKRIERGRKARRKLAKGGGSKKKRSKLLEQIEDSRQAREHLLSANSRLVVSVAKKHIGRGVPFLDLIQEGNIGLMRATKKFDYRRGYKFSTYATWWIQQSILRAIANHSRTIRLPAYMGDKIGELSRTQQQLKQQLGRDPTADELAEVLQVSPDKVEKIIKVARRPLSLETPTNAEGDSELGDFIEDQQTPLPEEAATEKMLSENISELLMMLPPREEQVLQLRYGLMDGRPYTLREVGDKMGVTRERIRQIETQALRRLRRIRARSKLADYLG